MASDMARSSVVTSERASGVRKPSPRGKPPALRIASFRSRAHTCSLINEVAELPHRVAVVLDDYQYIGAGDAHVTVAYFLEHLPENLHHVVSSRSDPPLPLG